MASARRVAHLDLLVGTVLIRSVQVGPATRRRSSLHRSAEGRVARAPLTYVARPNAAHPDAAYHDA